MQNNQFNPSISTRKIILFLGDIFIVHGSIFLSSVIRLGWFNGLEYLKHNPLSFMLTGLTFIITFFFAELYDTRKDFKSLGYIMTVVFASACAFVITTVLVYFTWWQRIGRGVFVMLGLLIPFFVIGWRCLFGYLADQPIFRRNALILGAGWAGKTILEEIAKSKKAAGLTVMGFIDDDPAKQNTRIGGLPVLGNRYSLHNAIQQNNVNLLITAITHEKHADLIKTLINCSWSGIEILDMPTMYEQLTGKIPFKHINDLWMLHTVISKPKLYGRVIKPVIECCVALILFTLLLPAMAIIAVLVKLDSRGGIFYTQERIGKDGRTFTIIKFRTMTENAEIHTGAIYTADKDPRITRVGRFLRKLRLDETPQLLNVIQGCMSLVGPRPERQVFIKEFEEKIPFYAQRLTVKPGLTGWAQVKYLYASSVEQTEEKLQYDLYYVKNMSFILDIVILLKTIKVVIFGSGR